MIRLDGESLYACDRIGRRTILQWGGLGALGLGLSQVLAGRARGASGPSSTADGCILVYLFGGPSQIDTFDLKPEAPVEFRGEFHPIRTNVPGIDVCEHLPRLSRVMDKLAVVRSMNHQHPRHGYGLYYMFTGRPHARPDLDAAPAPSDDPSLPSLVARFATAQADFPPAITVPRWNRFLDLPNDYAGETAGYLGRSFDPWLLRWEPGTDMPGEARLELPEGMTPERLSSRQDLLLELNRTLEKVGARELSDRFNGLYRQAWSLVASDRARRAFRVDDEPPELRERYGTGPFGQSLLLARRLIEAGTRLVTVNWHNDGSDVKSPFWDTHKDNFNSLKSRLLPPLDAGLSALLVDLDQRGLLERTLVVVMGEFGRTPRVGRVVMNAATDSSGRDHWPHAYTVLLSGGGVQGGQAYGTSDDRAAYVIDRPVSPPDLVATVLYALGIESSLRMLDLQGRPHPVCEGEPIAGLFG
jgi:hypothetical protein